MSAVRPAIRLAALVAALPIALFAQQPAAPVPTRVTSVEGITEYSLPNGMRVLLFPDASKPTVTVNVTYLVGSRHEGPGEAGMAHLLEHMLFKGTPLHPTLPKELEARGATYNGTTSFDRTNYYEVLPASDTNLVWALSAEADRMLHANVARADLQSEFTVVRNEFENNENSPFIATIKTVLGSAYLFHGYGRLPIGNRADIENVPIGKLQDFYHKFYQPDNAVLMVAGRFEEKKALDEIAKRFGTLPRPARTLEPTYTTEPTQDGEREITVRRVADQQLVGVFYHTPAGTHADFPAIMVLTDVMAAAPAGRLYKSIVEAKKGSSVDDFLMQQAEPGGVAFLVSLRKTDSIAPARQALFATIDEVRGAKPPTDEEVSRSKTNILKNIDLALTKSDQIGLVMSEYTAMGDWRLFFLQRDRIKAVTTADVRRVATAYLKPTNRTIGSFVSTDNVDRADIPAGPDVAALVKDYKGSAIVASGEAFDPTPANIEARVKRGTIAGTGLKLAYLPKKTRGETVNMLLVLRTGNEKALTNRGDAGDALGDMLMRGTKTLSRQQVKDTLDKLKARVGISSNFGATRVSIEAARANIPAVLDVMRGILREPAFDAKEFDEVQRASVQALEAQRSEPLVLAQVEFSHAISAYPRGNPRYAPTIDERLANIKAVTVADVKKFYDDFVGASAGEAVIVGEVDDAVITSKLPAVFAGWKSKVAYAPVPSRQQAVPASRKSLETPDKANAMFVAGHTFAMNDLDPAYPALALGSYIFGETPLGSRMITRLRQKDGLSYSAGTQTVVNSREPYGVFIGYAIYNPANAEKLEAGFFEEVDRLLKDGITADELEKAKQGWLQQRKVGRAQDASISSALSTDLWLGRTLAFDEGIESKVAALTVDEVNAALRKTIDPKKMVVVRAGDFAKAKQAVPVKP
ncbi:MAG: Zinc protease [Gemmatimonadetes bacterium]|nr:Zinc protease [Gemmatimonadota bacterium]